MSWVIKYFPFNGGGKGQTLPPPRGVFKVRIYCQIKLDSQFEQNAVRKFERLQRAREINRIQKVLEGANIKLSSVATDVLGKSGRAMIEVMIDGIEDPNILAELAQKQLKNKKEELKRALNGLIGPHQKLMLKDSITSYRFS